MTIAGAYAATAADLVESCEGAKYVIAKQVYASYRARDGITEEIDSTCPRHNSITVDRCKGTTMRR